MTDAATEKTEPATEIAPSKVGGWLGEEILSQVISHLQMKASRDPSYGDRLSSESRREVLDGVLFGAKRKAGFVLRETNTPVELQGAAAGKIASAVANLVDVLEEYGSGTGKLGPRR